ncbi:MAG: hypothetical protein ABSF46_11580 [Terriglobia bacterium]|jgi:hypothetical protein
MLRRWLWVVARSIAVGWAVLVVLTYLAERPLLFLAGPVVGAHWVETVGLTLDCLKLAATGWAIGRVHRAAPLPGVFAFAATLVFFNLEPWLPFDFPGLIRLAFDALEDARYLDSLATLISQHVLLLGSLIVGGLLSRPPQTPVSLFGETPR